MSTFAEFALAGIAGPDESAARAAQAILIEGGNALEAAIAAAAVAVVTAPHLNSLGGDSSWLIRQQNGRVRAIEAMGHSGAKASIHAYRDLGQETIPVHGPLAAATVPGLIGGWQLALDMARALGGKLPLDLLLAPAVAAARAGLIVGADEAAVRLDPALREQPGFAAAFLKDGKPADVGTVRKADALVATLAQLSHAGLDDFYRGDVARELAADMERLGVPVVRNDLRAYQPLWRAPLHLQARAGAVFAPPPPSPGIAALVGFGIAERLGIDRLDSFAFFHGMIESAKRGLVARDQAFMDFDGVEIDHDGLIEAGALQAEAEAVSITQAAPFQPGVSLTNRAATIAVTDMTGLTVVLAQSCGSAFGSGCVLPRTGVLLANGARAFSMEERTRFALAPKRRPRSALAPLIAQFKGRRTVAFAASGYEPQSHLAMQSLARLAAGSGAADVFDAPLSALFRTANDEPAFVHIDGRFDGSIARRLRSAGHEVRDADNIGAFDRLVLDRTGDKIALAVDGACAGL